MTQKLMLVDGSNQAFRAFFAIRRDMRGLDDFPTRALFGFTGMLEKLLRDHSPDHIAVLFDQGLSFRNELHPAYKGQRPDMPQELRQQWPEFIPLCREWGVQAIAMDGYEADDLIGTLTQRHASPERTVIIVSSDKDFCQLVGENVRLLDAAKSTEYGPPEVAGKWGVPPEKIVDLLSLTGDTSDNVPGVPGVGPKKAARYIQRFGSAAGVVENAATIGGKTGQRIAEHAETVALARRLVTIVSDIPAGELSLTLDDLARGEPDWAALAERFRRYNFRRLAARARDNLPEDERDGARLDRSTYKTIQTPHALAELVSTLRVLHRFSFDIESTSLDPRHAQIVGMSFCWDPGFAVYVPIAHTTVGSAPPERVGQQPLPLLRRQSDGTPAEETPVEEPEETPAEGNCPGALEALVPILADPTIKKTGQNLKYDLSVLRAHGYELAGIDGDTMLADYLLEADRKHGLDELALRYLDHSMLSYDELTKETDGAFAPVPIDRATLYAAEDTHAVWLIEKEMDLASIQPLYRDLELPLIPVLADMEAAGIGAERDALVALSAELDTRIAARAAAIHAEAGLEFNINSTQQLAHLLFDASKRGLTPIKKTKSGFSTDAQVLGQLHRGGDALSGLVLAYRELTKLKSTYVDALPKHIADDGRIHSSFHQAVAATGRLSSNDPNLQNIPIRTAEGRRIRSCFKAKPGHVFLSADYSQIELRILAHYCGDGPMVEAFARGEDIHKRTAAEIFGVELDAVTPEQRRTAKAINFGISYGMSAYRLSIDLGIPGRQAQAHINGYFERYPQVRRTMDEAIAAATERGHAITLLGRRRTVRGLGARNPVERQGAERIAINTPIQGTAADIIKIAMIRVHRELSARFPGARMLLQVHDELLLEVPEDQVDGVRELVVTQMEGVEGLDVPLRVGVGIGADWNAAH